VISLHSLKMKQGRLIIAANWKMNRAPEGALAEGSPYLPNKDIDVVVFATLLDLRRCIVAGIITGAQYGFPKEKGAYTGETSMQMICEEGAQYVLCGHSERRDPPHNETDEFIAEQVASALKAGIYPILCIGETEKEHDADLTFDVIDRQLKRVTLTPKVTIAYEPRWAIGSGKTPTPSEAQKIHAFIKKKGGSRTLYGGSMNGKNAKDFLKQPDIDGGLIGGASLKPKEFAMIVEAARAITGRITGYA